MGDPSICQHCGGVRRRKRKKGLSKGEWYCGACAQLKRKAYRDKNRVKYLEGKRRYYQEHKEEYKVYAAGYNETNKEKIKVRQHFYDNKNKARILANAKIYRKEKRHPDYGIWSHVIQRTTNKKNAKYYMYGARGIKVCNRWKESFNNFIKDMGERPNPKRLYSIERIDVNGDYCPENCKWATRKEQANNTRLNIKRKQSVPDNSPIYYPYGNLITLKEFSEKVKLPLVVAKYRYAQNWDAEWILHDHYDNRYYLHHDHKYNMMELSLLSGIRYSVLHGRIFARKWTIEKALSTP